MDFLAIGDIVTEPFIRLKDATVHCKINNEECEICMRWGDKIPYDYFVLLPAVGNASNAAVAAARLGLSSSLRAYVGADQYGKQCIDVLTKEKVDTSLIVTDPTRPSNYHYVLWYEDNRTILVKHEEYDYTVPEAAEAPKWVYLSSLAKNSLSYHHALAEWLKQYPDIKLAFQPGTFQMQLGKEALADIYQRSDIFFCNKEEAERILGIEPTDDLHKLLDDLQALGPKIVIITNDRAGAYCKTAEGLYYMVPLYPQPPAYEKTGAGDAFASSITAALALGVPLEQALLWGPINSMSVVAKVGAQEGLLSRAQLEDYLAKAPAEYKLQTL